jgi:hypothetical protein
MSDLILGQVGSRRRRKLVQFLSLFAPPEKFYLRNIIKITAKHSRKEMKISFIHKVCLE